MTLVSESGLILLPLIIIGLFLFEMSDLMHGVFLDTFCFTSLLQQY